MSLSLVVLAFTVPTERPEPPAPSTADSTPMVVFDVPPTAEAPPPPPPPAPPPPVEVDDAAAVEDVIAEAVFDPDAFLPAPDGPPSTIASVPPPPVDAPPPPRLDIEEENEKVWEFAEVQPELIGGLEGLQSRVEYPEFARRAGIEGQVVVQFVVDERGNVVDPVVLRSPNELLSEAAVKAVRESRFTPGQQRGRPVKVRFAVPVTFRLR